MGGYIKFIRPCLYIINIVIVFIHVGISFSCIIYKFSSFLSQNAIHVHVHRKFEYINILLTKNQGISSFKTLTAWASASQAVSLALSSFIFYKDNIITCTLLLEKCVKLGLVIFIYPQNSHIWLAFLRIFTLTTALFRHGILVLYY